MNPLRHLPFLACCLLAATAAGAGAFRLLAQGGSKAPTAREIAATRAAARIRCGLDQAALDTASGGTDIAAFSAWQETRNEQELQQRKLLENAQTIRLTCERATKDLEALRAWVVGARPLAGEIDKLKPPSVAALRHAITRIEGSNRSMTAAVEALAKAKAEGSVEARTKALQQADAALKEGESTHAFSGDPDEAGALSTTADEVSKAIEKLDRLRADYDKQIKKLDELVPKPAAPSPP